MYNGYRVLYSCLMSYLEFLLHTRHTTRVQKSARSTVTLLVQITQNVGLSVKWSSCQVHHRLVVFCDVSFVALQSERGFVHHLLLRVVSPGVSATTSHATRESQVRTSYNARDAFSHGLHRSVRM